MKKYRLLKDTFAHKAGTIAVCRGSHYDLPDTHNQFNSYFIEEIENNPEWFEEVQEKEFTEAQVMWAIEYAISRTSSIAHPEPSWLIQELRKQSKSSSSERKNG